jgi:hypothetical protein
MKRMKKIYLYTIFVTKKRSGDMVDWWKSEANGGSKETVWG